MIPDLPPGFWLDTVDSTMDEARRLIRADRIRGTAFVMARHQTAGRGTRGRAWQSPAGSGIHLTLVHLPTAPGEGFTVTPIYTLAAGVACAEAIQLVTGLDIRLKPINDLYAKGRKLGGILVESDLATNGITGLLTGIGINVHSVDTGVSRPEGPPISLEEALSPEAFARLNPDALVEAIVGKVCFWYSLVFQGYEGQVQRAWDALALTAPPGIIPTA